MIISFEENCRGQGLTGEGRSPAGIPLVLNSRR
jgi:hypothetical protein